MTPDTPVTGQTPPDIDMTVPSSARIWNYWQGGKDNYEVDRAAGDEIGGVFPPIWEMARANRQFIGRVVPYLTSQGVRQFLDVGCGLPTADAVHQLAQRIVRDARVVYVDHDPVVMAHARALLSSTTPEGGCDYVHADLHRPDRILEQAASTLDPAEPVAVILTAVLPHVPDDAEAAQIIRHLMDAVPSGSHLVLTHDTDDYAPDGSPSITEAMRMFAAGGGPRLRARGREQVAALAEGLEPVEPGIVWTSWWRPLPAPSEAAPVPQYALVARKP